MFTFNNKEIKKVKFNNNSLSRLLFNNIVIFESYQGLQLKNFVDGFVNGTTGDVVYNSNYPRAISSPLVLFEKGKIYKITSDLSATRTDDGVRFRIYDVDDGFKMGIGASQINTNVYATFEALDTAGNSNFYIAKDVKITPKQDFKCRIMHIDKNYISDFKLEEI